MEQPSLPVWLSYTTFVDPQGSLTTGIVQLPLSEFCLLQRKGVESLLIPTLEQHTLAPRYPCLGHGLLQVMKVVR